MVKQNKYIIVYKEGNSVEIFLKVFTLPLLFDTFHPLANVCSLMGVSLSWFTTLFVSLQILFGFDMSNHCAF